MLLTTPSIVGITAIANVVFYVSNDKKDIFILYITAIDLNFSDSMSNVISFELVKIGDTSLSY